MAAGLEKRHHSIHRAEGLVLVSRRVGGQSMHWALKFEVQLWTQVAIHIREALLTGLWGLRLFNTKGGQQYHPTARVSV